MVDIFRLCQWWDYYDGLGMVIGMIVWIMSIIAWSINFLDSAAFVPEWWQIEDGKIQKLNYGKTRIRYNLWAC